MKRIGYYLSLSVLFLLLSMSSSLPQSLNFENPPLRVPEQSSEKGDTLAQALNNRGAMELATGQSDRAYETWNWQQANQTAPMKLGNKQK